MTASYTLTRLVSIFVALKFKPEAMLSVHYCLTFLSIAILYFSNESELITWFGNILFGKWST